jgi:hypothetical protein
MLGDVEKRRAILLARGSSLLAMVTDLNERGPVQEVPVVPEANAAGSRALTGSP